MISPSWAVGLCSILWPSYSGAVPTTPSPSSSASSPTTSFNVVMDAPANAYLWVPQRDWQNFQQQGVLFNTNPFRRDIGEFGLELETSVGEQFSNGDTVIVELALGPHTIRSESHLSTYGVFFSQVRRYQSVEDREQANEAGWTVNDRFNTSWNQFGAISGQANYGVAEMRQMDQRYLNGVAADHFTRALLHYLTGPSSILDANLRQSFRRLIGWGEEQGQAQLLPAVTNPLSMDSIVVQYLSSLEADIRLARYGIREGNLANGPCPALIRTIAAHLGVGPSLWGRDEDQAAEIPGSCENAVSVYCRQQAQAQDGLCEAVKESEQTDVETCNYFKSLEVKLTMGNGLWGFDGAGTVDDIVIEFGGHNHQTILKHPSHGDEATISVDLEKAFGSKQVLVEAVKSFQLYSVQDEQKNPDSWEIGGLYIYGTCVESSRRVVIKKYDNVYDWFNRFGDMNPEYGSSHFNGHVALGDWQWETPDDKTKTIAVMPPGQPHACTTFKSLEAYLELGKGVYQGSGAGTNDEIMLDFSDSAFTPSNILLMSSPSRGDSVTKPIELESVFGKSVLSPKDVRQVAVYSREGTSHWADPWEVATHCEGSSKTAEVTKWRDIYQWFDRFEGPSTLSGELSLRDWHWA
ncbi:hypothetical protein H634G_08476 [Metarhizium anisopliae BRIP 53293]|uniref:Enterotoxin n=1 Tax=Metarhizium anisopliae BRIP 53293 TaxID=1291518 RepID=A0A0D9NQC2_METAN|nr:hypothetical protein H634G_08476 [Metarhizium anisopliae BRIP 53293]